MNDNENTEQGGYELVLSFPDQSPPFTYGFEAGGIWNRMKSGAEAEIEACLATENHEIYRRMCVSEGWDFASKDSGIEGWTYFTFIKVRKSPDRPNPRGFSVVQ